MPLTSRQPGRTLLKRRGEAPPDPFGKWARPEKENWYTKYVRRRNGVGVILSSVMKDKVVEVKRLGSRIMKVEVALAEEKINIVSVYAPQSGTDKRVISRIHEGWGTEARNEEGESIIDFAIAYDQAIVPTFFKKHKKLIVVNLL
ncbi:uncharacterized protein LOC125026898 [Penaeus chinensis]|uniref:uncharacterized protein LOC125026898 n=1 Tax=Penaeus chinensis TaxID=139456 RepID=UPI001FB683B8|nr:uncharacterized protein LOC125026898 [Penaeus chinensis]